MSFEDEKQFLPGVMRVFGGGLARRTYDFTPRPDAPAPGGFTEGFRPTREPTPVPYVLDVHDFRLFRRLLLENRSFVRVSLRGRGVKTAHYGDIRKPLREFEARE